MSSSTFRNDNLAANTKTANILSGDINEFIPVRSMVSIYTIATASGVRMTVLAGSDVAVDDKEIGSVGTSLTLPDNLVDSFAVTPGTRLAITLRETAGVATTDVLTRVDVQPF